MILSKGISDVDYYHVVTFQSKEVGNKLLSGKTYYNRHARVPLASEKYQELMEFEEDTEPIFTFLTLDGPIEKVVYPATITDFSVSLSLIKTCIVNMQPLIELKVPKSEGIIGTIGLTADTSGTIVEESAIFSNPYNYEFVINRIDPAWVVSIYDYNLGRVREKFDTFTGEEFPPDVEIFKNVFDYRPILVTPISLSQHQFHLCGDGTANNEDKLSDHWFEEEPWWFNLRRVKEWNQGKYLHQFCKRFWKRNFPPLKSKEFYNLYKLICSNRYTTITDDLLVEWMYSTFEANPATNMSLF